MPKCKITYEKYNYPIYLLVLIILITDINYYLFTDIITRFTRRNNTETDWIRNFDIKSTETRQREKKVNIKFDKRGVGGKEKSTQNPIKRKLSLNTGILQPELEM